MKILSEIDVTTRFKNYGNWAAFALLQKILQALDFPDVDGVQIVDFVEQNISTDGNGHATIAISLLESEIEIQKTGQDSVYLRNNDGVLEYSNDHETWTPIGSGGGSGDMTKAIYDVDDDGIVAWADGLKSGEDTLPYSTVADVVAQSANFVFVNGIFSFGAPVDFYMRKSEGVVQISPDGTNWTDLTTL